MTDITLCVTFVDPDGKRFDFVATKPLSTLPRVGERIALGPQPWNVLVVGDVTHQITGGPPILTCTPFTQLDNNQKQQDLLDLLRSAGFKEITPDVTGKAAEWRERSERRGGS